MNLLMAAPTIKNKPPAMMTSASENPNCFLNL